MLHNRVNTATLRDRARERPEPRTTLSFYRYVKIEDPTSFRDSLYKSLHELHVLGRIYVAHEGINAQASVPTQNLDALRTYLDTQPELANLRLNLAIEDDDASFYKLIIKTRDKIVADGLDDATFDPADGGTHLDAVRFNELAAHPDAVLVDMRNHYESEVGHFDGALRPSVDTFRESLPIVEDLLRGKEDAPVLMYCTGGIRCEKASAWFKHRGFAQVFQLDGGIINYARQVEAQGLDNRFVGKNFVFDERLGERIGHDVISRCHQCGTPCDAHTNCDNAPCHLLFLQCPACAKTYDGCCSTTCAEFKALPKGEREEVLAEAGRPIFNGQRYPNAHYRSSMGALAVE